ncbi:sorting nexin-14-like [Leguminivora glycinivorella]|uniref:sorting nexin-14-like n=1 Tax=Leguminivora glycinivorella TaxID=1035111 RepID=UPI00200D5EEA|nr:sorting nexin-14-like [Leguminivora glycinivorella]
MSRTSSRPGTAGRRTATSILCYVGSTSRPQLLQFFKDIKLFQTKLLDPNLKPSEEEQATLFREATQLLARRGNTGFSPNGDLKRLQTCPEIFTAANEVQAVLENVLLPRFLHSEEYYKILIGSRIPTGYQKQNKKAPPVRAKGPPRAPNSGLVLEHCSNEDGDDGALLACLEHLADELDDDLVTYKVVLTRVDIRMQAPPRTGTVRVFTLCVYCVERGAEPRAWTVDRSEHDFHLLRSKLLEFHGERLLQDLPLPSRRDNSPLETLRYKYEDFLQRALEAPLLQSSALLRLFLSGTDFALAAAAAALNGPDIGNMVTAVTHRLRKEKGQHLESFLRNYLLSADLERYQALKQGAGVEEAQEVSEDVNKRPRRRDIRESVFGNNFDVEPSREIIDGSYQDKVKGFTQCLMYLLIKVLHARSWLVHVFGGVIGSVRRTVDDALERWLNKTLATSLCERRLAHLIKLGHDILFGKKSIPPRLPATKQRQIARTQLRRAVPPAAIAVLGTGAVQAVDKAFELLQKPQFNKQLVYNLLDLCIMELFPELSATDNKSPNEPKS